MKRAMVFQKAVIKNAERFEAVWRGTEDEKAEGQETGSMVMKRCENVADVTS